MAVNAYAECPLSTLC